LELEYMKGTWSIRGFKDGDEIGINSLFNLIFQKDRSIDHWRWEFANNPKGSQIIVAVDKENIVGHLGGLKREMKIGRSYMLSSMEVDGMTHPDSVKQGVFVALGRRFLSDAKSEGVGLVFGFPNENAMPGHRKLDCVELFSLKVMVRPINFKRISGKMFTNGFLAACANLGGRISFGLLHRPKKLTTDEKMDIKTLDEFDTRFDDFWMKAMKGHNIILKRDSEYLNWRYVKCPDRQYKVFYAEKDNIVLGWIVLRTLDKFGLVNGAIVDILILPRQEKVAQALILQAVEELNGNGVDLIACSIPRQKYYHNIFRNCGFVECPKGLNPKEEPFIIYPLSEGIKRDFIKNPKNWYITWGDTDVV
jgi:hypothetical protein